MRRPALRATSRQRGAALMVLMLALGLLAAYFGVSALNRSTRNERNRVNAAAFAQARDALIGSAVTYRDSHAGEGFGFLLCPDATNNGITALSCGAQDVSVYGRLPWRTLGLPPLRDHGGECLWYALSGSAKYNPKTAAFNWDTLGQFVIRDADGNLLAGATPHDRPLVLILAPGATLGAQARAGAASECGGNVTQTNYLEGIGTPAAGVTTITLATAASSASGANNDAGVWVTSAEIFEPIMRRTDFRDDIDRMLSDLTSCLGNWPSTDLPDTSPSNKGILDATILCPPAGLEADNTVRSNWENNLLYTKPATPASVTVNGITTTGCSAVLLFGGSRTTGQTRDTAASKDNPAMYLEGGNAALFPNSGNYTGLASFDAAAPTSDLVRCVTGLPAGVQTVSFAKDFNGFVTAGAGVTKNTNPNPSKSTVTIGDAAGASGGCFWHPNSIPLAGKTLRLYYTHTFSFPDPAGGADRGNGFTLQMVRGDLGSAPNTCGSEAGMGALGMADAHGNVSFIVESDVYRNAGNNDAIENHTAIMYGGNLTHSATNGTLTAACDGSAAGCRHATANKFEEAPPAGHNQRIEIHTGCNAGCTACNPPGHAAPNTYARISVWVDCRECLSIAADLDRLDQPPTVNRCIALPAAMNSIYFGFTGGFRSGASQQGVTLGKLYLGSE